MGTQLTCASSVGGEKFNNTIHVLNPEKTGRDDIGDAIAAGRKAPYHNTVVAAGNWFVRVAPAKFAPRIAEALGGVVLPPYGKASTAPAKSPYGAIPASPVLGSLDELADAVGGAVGCSSRRTRDNDSALTFQDLTCTTGTGAEHRRPDCAKVTLYDDRSARDEGLRTLLGTARAPKGLVAGGNWTVSLCTGEQAEPVAKVLGGAVVR